MRESQLIAVRTAPRGRVTRGRGPGQLLYRVDTGYRYRVQSPVPDDAGRLEASPQRGHRQAQALETLHTNKVDSAVECSLYHDPGIAEAVHQDGAGGGGGEVRRHSCHRTRHLPGRGEDEPAEGQGPLENLCVCRSLYRVGRMYWTVEQPSSR